jgi:hypothetical protein
MLLFLSSLPVFALIQLASPVGPALLIRSVHILLRSLNIAYSTIYLDFPDLAPKFTALDIPPNTNPNAHGAYTAPVLHFIPTVSTQSSSGSYIMDSDLIIHALHDRGYLQILSSDTKPAPSDTAAPTLTHSKPLANKLEASMTALATALAPFVLPAIVARIPARGASYYRAKHEPNLPSGISSFEEFRDSTTLDACFKATRAGIEALETVTREARLLRADNNNNNAVGNPLMTWEEIAIVALLAFLGRIDPRLWEGVMAVAGEIEVEKDQTDEGSALCQLWCEAEGKGLVGEVFGS